MDDPERSEDQERRMPAQRFGDVASCDRSEPSTGEDRGLVDGKRTATHLRLVPVADQSRGRRIISRLPYGDEGAHRKEQREAGGEGGSASCDAPEDQPIEDNAASPDAVADPARNEGSEGIDPEEHASEQCELTVAQAELFLEVGKDGNQDVPV